jgi:hypothetical protein
MIGIFIAIGGFAGIMIPTLLISAIPKLSIKILELFRIYEKGTLTTETTTYLTGSGYYRQGKVYMYRGKGASERFDNGRVFGYLLLIFVPSSVFVLLLVYLFISYKYFSG